MATVLVFIAIPAWSVPSRSRRHGPHGVHSPAIDGRSVQGPASQSGGVVAPIVENPNMRAIESKRQRQRAHAKGADSIARHIEFGHGVAVVTGDPYMGAIEAD